jgi:hypothetical protein
MKITEELEQIIKSDFEAIEKFELTYKNGGKVVGTTKKIKYSPLRLSILKDPVPKGEKAKHRVMFDHVINISLIYKDNSVRKFE